MFFFCYRVVINATSIEKTMALSKYDSTNETINFIRVAQIILGPCSDVLRDILTKEMIPTALSHNVKTFDRNLPRNTKSPISKQQKTFIDNEDYLEFDITLLYVLFRNICSIPPHSENWGNKPRPNDRCLSANIERIRLMRNKYFGHNPSSEISDSDFTQTCDEIFQIVQELEKYLGTSTLYQKAVLHLTTRDVTYAEIPQLVQELQDLKSKLESLSGKSETYEEFSIVFAFASVSEYCQMNVTF